MTYFIYDIYLFYFTAILLSDVPKVISSFSILRENFKSRFGSQDELTPLDNSDTLNKRSNERIT